MGDVASWDEIKTRKVSRQPMSPNAANSIASNHLDTERLLRSNRVMSRAKAKMREKIASGVRYQGVGESVASGL